MPRYAYFFWKAGKRLVFEDFRNRSAEIGEGVPSESYLSRLDDSKITSLPQGCSSLLWPGRCLPTGHFIV